MMVLRWSEWPAPGDFGNLSGVATGHAAAVIKKKRAALQALPPYGAAKESNLPSVGPPRPAGFEDPMR
jgi:hypothetical protein